MNCTPWFKADINPVREGVYEIEFPHGAPGFSYWNGVRWGSRMPSIKSAQSFRRQPALGPVAAWRGLAEDASKKGGGA
jgi:hypothetical protein